MSVVCTLLCRAETVVSELQDVAEEMKHVKKVVTVNGYKKSPFQIFKKKVKEEYKQTESPTANTYLVCIPIHLLAVRTATEGIQIPRCTLLPQTFQHHKVPVG